MALLAACSHAKDLTPVLAQAGGSNAWQYQPAVADACMVRLRAFTAETMRLGGVKGLAFWALAEAAFLGAERVTRFMSGVTASCILGLPSLREGLLGGKTPGKDPAHALSRLHKGLRG